MPPTSLTLTPPDTGWIDRVICRDMGAVMDGETPEDERHAKELCHACPVKQDCRSYALSLPPSKDFYGVAGGLTVKERQDLRRRNRRSRPPEPQETKQCPRCREEKPLGQFYLRPERADGRDTYCRPCCVELTQERRAAKKAAGSGDGSH
jgi:WhiB family redox-sensing transcriptional regulator